MDDNHSESSYQDGFRDGEQSQINKQTAAFFKWIVMALTAIFFGAVAILVNMWVEKLQASVVGFSGGVLYSYIWKNEDFISTGLGSIFGI